MIISKLFLRPAHFWKYKEIIFANTSIFYQIISFSDNRKSNWNYATKYHNTVMACSKKGAFHG